MALDVVVSVDIERLAPSANEMNLLILSTEGAVPLRTYSSLEDVATDYVAVVEETTVRKKAYLLAKAIFEQPLQQDAPGVLRRVTMVGINPPADAAGIQSALSEILKMDDNWYVLLTDFTDDELLLAAATWIEGTGNSEASDIRPKLGVFKTQNDSLSIPAFSRSGFVFVDPNTIEDGAFESPEAAWAAVVAPWYPQSVNWKFRQIAGATPTQRTFSEKDALERANFNFLTTENKRSYMKNGTAGDGTFLDLVVGSDWIENKIRNNLYDAFLANRKIGYSDDGFTVVLSAVLSALDDAAEMGIVAVDAETGQAVYTVDAPSRSEATPEQVAARAMPPIKWSALQEGAINTAQTHGVLRVTL